MSATPAKDIAATILAQLGQDFSLPNVDLTGPDFQLPDRDNNPLYAPIEKIEIEELTVGEVDGTGAFDKIMSSHRAHLKDQYERGLISGDQYTKAYIELTTLAMNGALQFLLSQQERHWGAALMQAQARKAEIDAVASAVQLEIAKVQLVSMKHQEQTLKAQYVLTLMQIANEDAKYALTKEQTELADRQVALVNEQIEAQRAQTQDTRTNGAPVTGMIGKQRELYTEQISSYRKDAQQKGAKLFVDGWITQKTIDEGLLPPTNFTNAELDEVLTNLRNAIGV